MLTITAESTSRYFQRKLKLMLRPESDQTVTVSKNRAGEFKQWLEGKN